MSSQREIKFRAWLYDGECGAWAGNVAFYYPDGGWFFDGDGGWETDELKGQGITVEQYTGLKDKNGREIYEGDILDPGNRDGSGAYAITWCGHGWNTFQSYSWLGYSTSSEHVIIGNIHEHPELLESK